MNTEQALMVLLSNPVLDEIGLKRIEHILKHSIDWYKVFYISLIEKTTFFIYKNLLQYHYFWSVPNCLISIWETAYWGNTKRNKKLLYYDNILHHIFSCKGITTISGSGIMLLNSVYHNMLGVRQLHDIDFFTQKSFLSDIDIIMHNLDFKKLYINDSDLFSYTTIPNEYSILYSKFVDSMFINCDFCSHITEYPTLYPVLFKYLKNKKTPEYYFSQLIILYISALKSWDGTYYINDIKHYSYSKLIDIHLYKRKYAHSMPQNLLKEIKNISNISETMQDVDKCLTFFEKEGYLT